MITTARPHPPAPEDVMHDITPDGRLAELPAAPSVLDGPCVAVNGAVRLFLDPSDPTEPLVAVSPSGGILRGFAGLAEVEASYDLTAAQVCAILNLAISTREAA